LDRVAASKLTLVSAPAGFGKTTQFAEWLAAGSATPTNEQSAAWLSLDQGGNDPASFWTHVIAALRTVAPGVGETTRSPSGAPTASDPNGDLAAQRPWCHRE
jgi:LuxR family maltose regulon positive regulatory protein